MDTDDRDRDDGRRRPPPLDTRPWGYDPNEDRAARRDVELDAEREPGRAAHLAAGSGGEGEWQASAAGSGRRRGLDDPDAPWRGGRGEPPRAGAGSDRDDRDRDAGAPGASYGGWAPAGSTQGRWSDPTDGRIDPPPLATGPDRPRGPKGWQRTDARLHDDICDRIARDDSLDSGDVSVSVRGGLVTLEGTVADRPTKHAIESLVDACVGVREIDNRIKVMRVEAHPPDPDAPPKPRPSVPQDSPTARDAAQGRTTRLTRDGSGYLG